MRATGGEGKKNDTGNRQKVDALFERLAKVRWPIAPDLDPTQLDQESLAAIGKQGRVCADNVRAQIRAMYPSLTESDLDELLM